MNRLGLETSPYLRQHEDNPVDWFAWGEEAFERAREKDVPIFVSIGYSACHWCHVMAHESFEDVAVADQLNRGFVSIKVDREERPDIDAVYLEAVQALTGSGGWPLSVFLDHQARPFFGGTYFPTRPAHGLPSFSSLLDAVSDAWHNRRDDLAKQAGLLTESITERLTPGPDLPGELSAGESDQLIERAIERYSELFDSSYGGIGEAPKFPQAPMLELLCLKASRGDQACLSMLQTTLSAMASGGIYDHLGGGFARYSVDRQWLVPHFEKMAYDQAALARVYLHAYQLTGEQRWRQVFEETLGYVLRDLRDPTGGIYSAEDADSEGEEGRFYLWSAEEVNTVLGADAPEALAWYGMTEGPNFEGRSILFRPDRGELIRPLLIEKARAALFSARSARVRPGLDDKIVTEQNAMIASVLAEAGAATENERYLTAATEIGEFLYANLRRSDGRWLRTYSNGAARHLATASDYAWLIDCYTRLAEARGDARDLERAEEVAHQLIELFSAPGGGFFLTGKDAPALVVRPQDSHDGVVPAAGSIAASALARLGAISTKEEFSSRARAALGARLELMRAAPIGFAHLLQASAPIEHGFIEIVISGDRRELVRHVQARYLPDGVIAWGEPTSSSLWEGRRDKPGAYVCRSGVCRLPVDDLSALSTEIAAVAGQR